MEAAKDTLRDKTAAQVIVEVRGILKSLQIPDEMINRLVENRNYTPADLLMMSRALVQIGAQNSAVYLDVRGGRAIRAAWRISIAAGPSFWRRGAPNSAVSSLSFRLPDTR